MINIRLFKNKCDDLPTTADEFLISASNSFVPPMSECQRHLFLTRRAGSLVLKMLAKVDPHQYMAQPIVIYTVY